MSVKPANKSGIRRDAHGRLLPGQALNPTGRPKVADEFRARARKAVDEHVLTMWVNEVKFKGEEWVKCSELLAAYGYGRPSQSVELTAEVTQSNPFAELTLEELKANAKYVIEKETAKLE